MRARNSRHTAAPTAAVKTPTSMRARSSVEKSGTVGGFMRISDHSTLSRIQYHLPELLALFQPLMCCCCFAQWKTFIDHRLNLAGKNVFHHLMEIAHRPH